jgi:prophage regulatory protein
MSNNDPKEVIDMTEHILRLKDVAKTVGLSTSSIYRLISKGDFPKQIKLSQRSSGWLESDVNTWLTKRINTSRKVIGGKSNDD